MNDIMSARRATTLRTLYAERVLGSAGPLREWASRAPGVREGHAWLAATLAQLGRLDEAHAEAAEVLRIDPKFSIDATQRRLSLYKRPEDAEHIFDGLRKADLPER
jgi:adenylate cyclase